MAISSDTDQRRPLYRGADGCLLYAEEEVEVSSVERTFLSAIFDCDFG